MGHQIGTEVHENPWLKPESEEPLRAGMVMCIEPKLWLPGEYYFRLEEIEVELEGEIKTVDVAFQAQPLVVFGVFHVVFPQRL